MFWVVDEVKVGTARFLYEQGDCFFSVCCLCVCFFFVFVFGRFVSFFVCGFCVLLCFFGMCFVCVIFEEPRGKRGVLLTTLLGKNNMGIPCGTAVDGCSVGRCWGGGKSKWRIGWVWFSGSCVRAWEMRWVCADEDMWRDRCNCIAVRLMKSWLML